MNLQNGPTHTYQSNKYLPLLALCLGFFMVIIDVTIVNVALPIIAKKLNGGIAWLQWVVDGYTLTFACLLLTAGHLTDRMGAKTAFIVGQILFVLTSIGCGLSFNFWQLTSFRFLQGASAALLVPTSLTLINTVYEKAEERAWAIGLWAAIGGIAAAAGPILGGVLTEWFGWRSIFFVNVPIGAIGIILTIRNIPSSIGKNEGGFDYAGQILGVISIGALAFSLIEAGRLGWTSPLVLVGLIVFIVSTFLFLIVEHHSKNPMLSLKLFHSKNFSVAIVIGMILNIGVYGELFILSLYFQQIKHYSVLVTGFAFLPLLGIITIASYLGGKVTSMLSPKLPMEIGLAVGTIGFLSLLIISAHTPYSLLVLPLMAIGFGIAFTMPATTVLAIRSAPRDKTGIASGALNASRQIGSLLGVAIFGTIINISLNFITGMHITLIISGVSFFVGCMTVLLWVKQGQ